MKILLISDIHANFYALSSLSKYFSFVDLSVCLGDMVGYYCQVNEVIDFLREQETLCILGNHDQYLLSEYPENTNSFVKFGIEFAKKNIRTDNFEWLNKRALIEGLILDGLSFLFFHGSPWNPLQEYLYSDNKKITNLTSFNYDIFCFGHTHRSYISNLNEKIIVNPGSVGQNRKDYGLASAYIFDTKKKEGYFVNSIYNWIETYNLARYNGAGTYCKKHFPGNDVL